MKTFEDMPVPATTRRSCVSCKCDLCPAETKHEIGGDGNWGTPYTYSGKEITVEVRFREEISDHDGGGQVKEVEADLCPNCFLTKLVPWLESQGAKVKKEERSY